MLYHNVRLVGTHLLVIDAFSFALVSVISLWIADSDAFIWVTESVTSFLSIFAIALAVFIGIGSRLDAYHARRTERLSLEIASLAEVTIYASAISMIAAKILGFPIADASVITVVLVCTGSMTTLRLLMRLMIRQWRRKGKDDQIWLVVGCGERAENLAKLIRDNKHFGIRIHEIVDLPRQCDEITVDMELPENIRVRRISEVGEIREIIKNNVIDEIVVTLPLRSFYDETKEIIAIGRESGISIMLQPNAFDQREHKSAMTMTGDFPMVIHYTGPSNYVQLGIKRLIDILGSVVGLVALSPLFAIIAIAIKIDSPGKVLFRSERTGLHGRKFQMVKFRSMVSNAPALRDAYHALNQTDGVAFKIKDDPRITRVGRVLRSWHLDELAQLWNVLVGDMSLVGPRPLPNDEACGREWWHLRRLSMPPGLTCFWQITGDHAMPFKDWARLDLEYIDNWSVWLDLKLIFLTVFVVFRRPGW